MSARAGRPAFTLLELVAVLMILSLMAALAVPSLRGFARAWQTTDAATQIVVLTQYAHSQCVAEGRPFRFNLDSEGRGYWLTAQKEGVFARLGTEYGRTFELPADTTARWESPEDVALRGYIQFYPNGSHDVAVIRVSALERGGARVLCDSPAEPFRVMDVPLNQGATRR